MKKIVFQTGGRFHPVEAQANLIQSWLPDDWKIKTAFGTEAFEQLADADLYVAGGLHWTVLSDLSVLSRKRRPVRRSRRSFERRSEVGERRHRRERRERKTPSAKRQGRTPSYLHQTTGRYLMY
jgi:hypothetical protein